MNFITSPTVKESVPYNGILVRKNNESSWKAVFDDEARKINPLHDVNTSRNNLILDAIKKNDWSDYNNFQAKQHPAWYEQVDGKFVPNKVYYGNLIESKISALKEAQASNDQEAIATWQRSLDEAIEDFNNAPGIVPYVVGLNHTEDLAAEHGVLEPGDDYFDSKWNSPLVLSQGKFEQNMWFDNPVFAENQVLKQRVETLVAGTFPTSSSIVKKAEETVAAAIADPVSETPVEEEALFEDKVSIQSLYMQNLKFDMKPNMKVLQELYG